MKLKIKKKIYYYSGVLLAGMLFSSGCGNEIPEMNEEEKSMVVNYAADIVQKYDSNHPLKLQAMIQNENAASVTEEQIYEDENPEDVLKEEASAKQDDSEKKEDSADTTGKMAEVIDNTVENNERTLDEIIMAGGFHFSYEGYETEESYPPSGTEAYFAMKATEGNELLILKFLASNQTASDEVLNMIQYGIRFKIVVNGENRSALTTMLLNDFANYKNVIAAGESEELVVICEIPREQVNDISSLALIVKNADETSTIPLY